MNSHIKFRAWQISEGKWFDDYFSVCRVGAHIFDIEEFSWNVGADVVLMQFTGQKDKNGREIYEGDVCVIGLYDGRVIRNTLIVYDPAQGQYCHRTETRDFSMYCEREVIGNIYENPELLKQKE